MKSLCVAILGALLVLGIGGSVIAQQSGASSSAQSEVTKPADDKATSSSSSSSSEAKPEPSAGASAPAPDRSSSSTSTSVDVKTEPRVDVGKDKGDIGSASPRTSTTERRIFGLEPTAAILIGAAILLVVILALVAMARGSSETSHTDIDLRR